MSLLRSSRVLLVARLPIASNAARAPVAMRHMVSNAGNSSHESTSIAHGRTVVPSRSHEPTQPKTLGSIIPEEVSDAPCDSATSAYSPVPLYPENRGPDEPLAAAVISGAPLELQARTVCIYKPAKPATQSGNWNGRQWRMDWDVLGKGHRWENPLMGWQSSGDFMQGSHIFFKTKEDAIHFAEKQGYQWFVQEPNTRDFRVKSYAANFLHSPKKLKIIRTK